MRSRRTGASIGERTRPFLGDPASTLADLRRSRHEVQTFVGCFSRMFGRGAGLRRYDERVSAADCEWSSIGGPGEALQPLTIWLCSWGEGLPDGSASVLCANQRAMRAGSVSRLRLDNDRCLRYDHSPLPLAPPIDRRGGQHGYQGHSVGAWIASADPHRSSVAGDPNGLSANAVADRQCSGRERGMRSDPNSSPVAALDRSWAPDRARGERIVT
jgi:hypothetical protein